MNLHDYDEQRQFWEAWNAVEIVRPVEYSLFTFGDSELEYFLVCNGRKPSDMVSVRRGKVIVTRMRIITPDSFSPEFQNFFENAEEEQAIGFLLSRTAMFSNLKLQNQQAPARMVTDSVEEAVAKLDRQLTDEEEDHVAIVTAPPQLAGFALFKYATERIQQSIPDNVQELRERGLLP